MSLEDIDRMLPNGFHDAQIESLDYDFVSATVKMRVQCFAASPEDRDSVGTGYRLGKIEFTGVKFCAIDPPVEGSSFLHTGSLWITSIERNSPVISESVLKLLPENIPCYSLFNRDWYSEIHIAAADAHFEWCEPDIKETN